MSKIDEPIWLQITAGRGPAECQLAAAKLVQLIDHEAKAASVACAVIDSVAGDEKGTLLSALLSLEGAGGHALAMRHAGSVLWIAASPFRPHHKRKNWYVGVELLVPPVAASTTEIAAADVHFEAMRASGPGGQHVNKTESAVRATHRPTGLTVVAREERSQLQNKRLALARLASLLAAEVSDTKAGADLHRWQHHSALERGKPTRTFVGPDFRERP
jgi:peptide chain release factor